jgi:hypothetical protein
MRPIWLVHAAAVAAALLAASFISFPSFSGGGLFTVNPPTVDRTFKGDRLPLTAPAGSPLIGAPASPQQQSREKILVGCDGAFSPITSPRLANVFRRCTV